MIKIYHNPRCQKSREGLEILKESGKDFEVVQYLKDVPSEADLKEILQLLQIPAIELVRTKESIWKEQYKGKDLSEQDIIKAMATHPKLIERPIVIHGKKAVIGRPASNIKGIL